MLNTIFSIVSAVVAVFGVVLVFYYALTKRKDSIDSFLDRNTQIIKEDDTNQSTTIQDRVGPVKVFVYLDENKMYSLSSQLFEGITNVIMEGDSRVYGRGESQQGEFASGSFMANMMFQQSSHSEGRSLNDFAFTVFEKELERRGLLYHVRPEDSVGSLKGRGFVKISGLVTINDYSNTLYTIDHFNDIGKAVGYMQHGGSVSEKQLMEEGLILDKTLQEKVKQLVSFGYKDRLEFIMNIQGSDLIYSTTVNREYLKDSEDIFVSRYSRLPEKLFSVVGIISQIGESSASGVELDGNGLKKNIRLINSRMAGMEASFNGRADNECIIDPIAIFTEISQCQ